MGRDDLFARREATPGCFTFDESLAAVFDDMLVRSIPLYAEQQCLVVDLVRRLWPPGSIVVDLGCATGTTLIALATAIGGLRGVGVDASEPVLARAAGRVREAGLEDRISLVRCDLDDATGLPLGDAGVVTMLWTLQFVAEDRREWLVREIHDALSPDGALIVAEKVVAREGLLDTCFAEAHDELRLRNGYSPDELRRKRVSLEGVLVPRTIRENVELFRRAGFAATDTFFQWCNFAGFVCLKPGARVRT